MVPSKDAVGKTAAQRVAVDRFMKNTAFVHRIMAAAFEEAFPEDDFKKYRSAFEAAKSSMPDDQAGAWLLRALVWLCQVGLHRDGGDQAGSICATVNAGAYEPATDSKYKTAMLLPDVKVAYRSVCSFDVHTNNLTDLCASVHSLP
jgi:hypothetical protein